jgi:putative ATP-dependent endonuclease of OLD family
MLQKLRDHGNDLSENFYVAIGLIDLADVPRLTDEELLNDNEARSWVAALQDEGVYLSFPLDIDFSMLAAFPEAYRKPNPGGRGPRGDAEALREKKAVTLKTGGNPNLYAANFNEQFTWYPYLFLDRSKPETHLTALSQLSDRELADSAPPELKALIERVKSALKLDGYRK